MVICCALTLGAPTAAAAAPRISANPQTVGRGEIQTVRGRDWPVIEFCSRTIRVSVRRAQNAVAIAQRHVGDDGNFKFRWIPKNKNVGRGSWTLVARMRCESGKDGSTIFVTRRRQITVD
jgi:hypothetical protein